MDSFWDCIRSVSVLIKNDIYDNNARNFDQICRINAEPKLELDSLSLQLFDMIYCPKK